MCLRSEWFVIPTAVWEGRGSNSHPAGYILWHFFYPLKYRRSPSKTYIICKYMTSMTSIWPRVHSCLFFFISMKKRCGNGMGSKTFGISKILEVQNCCQGQILWIMINNISSFLDWYFLPTLNKQSILNVPDGACNWWCVYPLMRVPVDACTRWCVYPTIITPWTDRVLLLCELLLK